MDSTEQKELIELTKKLLKIADKCSQKPFYITSFIRPVGEHSKLIAKLKLL